MELSNTPEKIYLQIKGAEPGGDFNKLVGVSWCADRINESDLEYVSALRAQQLLEALEELMNYINEIDDKYDDNYDPNDPLTVIYSKLHKAKNQYNKH